MHYGRHGGSARIATSRVVATLSVHAPPPHKHCPEIVATQQERRTPGRRDRNGAGDSKMPSAPQPGADTRKAGPAARAAAAPDLAQPRVVLRALRWKGLEDGGCARVAEGHPGLQELRLEFSSITTPWADEPAWLRVARGLPSLARLALHVDPGMFGGDEAEGRAATTSWVPLACAWLRRCARLTHLSLTAVDVGTKPVHEMLDAVGAAVGGQLLHLTIGGAELPPTRAAAAGVLRTLATRYPRLRALTLHMFPPDGMEESAAEARAREVLLPMSELAALCPALREVCVRHSPSPWFPTSQETSKQIAWVRPKA